MTWRRLRTVRRVVQAVVFAGFVVLLFTALQRRTAFPFADVFFRFDPLVLLGASLAGREWAARAWPALVTLGATIALGRVWCGWICPLGTLLEWFTFKRARRRAKRLPSRLPVLKYLVLIAIVAAAALGNLTLLILDPIALITRASGTAVIPAVNWAVLKAERALYDAGLAQGQVDVVEQALRGRVLPQVQPVFRQAVPIFALLLVVVLLGLLADRFFCRYVCPLGALLGLVGRLAILRPLVRLACDRCSACARVCCVDAIDVGERAEVTVTAAEAKAAGSTAGGAAASTEAAGSTAGGAATDPVAAGPGASVVTAECVMCLDCLVACGRGDMTFGLSPRPQATTPYDPGRREFLTAAVAGAAGVVLLGAGVWNRYRSPALIRPPGAQDEELFLSRCVRCSQCMKVCPTSGLQPSFDEAGLAGLWTPVLHSRLGYCDYGCNACGQVCPSGAIPRLGLTQKREQILGLAFIDKSRCLPWASSTPCLVCQEMCPVPDKAVKMRSARVPAQGGVAGWMDIEQPYVVSTLCIGCGICEYRCPVAGDAAIRVVRA